METLLYRRYFFLLSKENHKSRNRLIAATGKKFITAKNMIMRRLNTKMIVLTPNS